MKLHSVANKISTSLWSKALSNWYDVIGKFQNLNMMFRYAADAPESKVEQFNFIDTFNMMTNVLMISISHHNFDVKLSFEDGIPDELYGDVDILKQLIIILLTIAYRESNNNISTTCYSRFLKLDELRRWLIEIQIGVPKSKVITVENLSRIFKNKYLGSKFFYDFKDALKLQDLGIFLWGYLVSQWDGQIDWKDSDQHVMVIIKLPFSLSWQNQSLGNSYLKKSYNYGDKLIEGILRQNQADQNLLADASRSDSSASCNRRKSILNKTKMSVSPISGNESNPTVPTAPVSRGNSYKNAIDYLKPNVKNMHRLASRQEVFKKSFLATSYKK